MNIQEFIFSANRKKRIQRHVVFWATGYLFFVSTYPPGGYGNSNAGFLKFYEMVFIRDLFDICSQMIFCYGLMYFILPVFFWKKKYFQFTCSALLLWIIVFLFTYLSFSYVYNPVIKSLGLTEDASDIILLVSIKVLFFTSISSRVFIFISLKLFKDWQQKQKDIFTLKKENAEAELSLLKAQVHPHFLFNTLNNIYSFALNKSNKAKHLVSKLEHMLYYMTEECNEPLVTLDKEIKLLTDYIELERVRYDERFKIEVELKGEFGNKLIAPLLMIPFVENSFKHGASKMLTDCWTNMFIQADEDVLHFSLINNKIANSVKSKNSGIGVNNVKKRLELLYPSTHFLNIETTTNTFTVNMQVPLQKVEQKIVV